VISSAVGMSEKSGLVKGWGEVFREAEIRLVMNNFDDT